MDGRLKAEDLLHKKFGSITVMSRESNTRTGPRWKVLCDCGIERVLPTQRVKNSKSTCGYACLLVPSAFNRTYDYYQRNAKRRGHSFSLTKEEFLKLTSSPCHYTGKLPSMIRRAEGGKTYVHNGIDRLDNTKGYTVENCVPCCKDANYAKRDMGYEDFISMCKMIANKHAN